MVNKKIQLLYCYFLYNKVYIFFTKKKNIAEINQWSDKITYFYIYTFSFLD